MLERVVFIGAFDTNASLKRIEKNGKMRRTGQNRRRTGQREGNPAELTTERLKKVWTELTKFNRIIGVGWNVESIKSYQKISMPEFFA